MQLKSKSEVLLLISLVLICFSMRSPISPVGPLVSQIKASLDLSAGFAGLLTTIPLLLFGIVSSFAGKIMNKFSDKVLIPSCLGLSFAGILLRSYLGIGGLLLGTSLIGLGIGILNVAMPVFIRANYRKKIGFVMGVYTMSMALLSAVSAGVCVQLSGLLDGWSNSLAAFAVFPVLAVPVWLLAVRQGFIKRQPTQSVPLMEIVKSRVNWYIALYMGFQSSVFFCLIAWLPSVLIERGATKEEAGLLMLMMQIISLPMNFLMPVLMQRFPLKKGLLALLSGAMYVTGFLFLLQTVTWMWILGVILLGIASGLCFSFALTLITVRGRNEGETAGISAFSQCIGYLLAAPSPAILGLLNDVSGSFFLPLLALIFICVPMVFSGIGASGSFFDKSTHHISSKEH